MSLSVKNELVAGNGRRNHCDTSPFQWLIFSEAVINIGLTFKRRIKSHLPSAGIIRSSPYSPRFQDKG